MLTLTAVARFTGVASGPDAVVPCCCCGAGFIAREGYVTSAGLGEASFRQCPTCIADEDRDRSDRERFWAEWADLQDAAERSQEEDELAF